MITTSRARSRSFIYAVDIQTLGIATQPVASSAAMVRQLPAVSRRCGPLWGGGALALEGLAALAALARPLPTRWRLLVNL